LNLYTLDFKFYAPKDSKEGILTYLVAENDEQVYEWIKTEPDGVYVSWMYKDNPEGEYGEYEEGFKERIIACRGDMYDDESEVSDLYYGATQYGWTLVKEDINYVDVIQAKNSLGIKIINV